MENDNNKFPKIKDLVIKAIKEGEEKTDLTTEITPFWYQFFHYKNDPLDTFNSMEPFDKAFIDLFVNRETEIKVISNYIGMAKNIPRNLHIAIIGSIGIGKHTTMKIITNIVKESFPQIKLEFYNHQFTFDYKNNKEITWEEINELDNANVDIRIISCSGKNKWFLIKRIKDFKKNSKLTFSIWHTSEYPKEQDISVNKEIFFRNYKKDDVIEILIKRINKFLKIDEKSKKYYESLKEDLIPKIAEFSKGNLKICFRLFKDLHLQARIINMQNINIPLINKTINRYLCIKNQKLTGKEKEIIKYYLLKDNVHYITTTDLKEDLGYDRTIAWKYLENLIKKNVFEKIKYGNPSRYSINEIFLSFYEEQLKKEIIFKE